MVKKDIKKKAILGILFLLPVLFVLVLSLSKENYNPLDIVNKNVAEIPVQSNLDLKLKDHITVLAFFGKHPMSKSIAALNLKELVYDKFKGFKKFQIVVLIPHDAKEESETLFKEIASYEDLRFWHFAFANEQEINRVFNNLEGNHLLDLNLASDQVFIIDTDLNQRGRIDDREENEKAKGNTQHSLYSYSCIEVAELKNKMAAEDLRVLFTEYRQRRKGDFDSATRREQDLKGNKDE